jgi:hypothetical protein
MFSFIIPSGLFECQLDIGRERTQRMCEMKAMVVQLTASAAYPDVIIRESG